MNWKLSVASLCVAVVLTAGMTATAPAQVVLNLGTFIVDDDANVGDIPLAIPAGEYNHFSLSTDWTPLSGDPWSDEAIFAIASGPLADPATTFFADPGPAPNSAGSGDPVTLLWDSFLGEGMNGPLNAFLLTLQTFAGSTAEWRNTTVEFSSEPVVPLTLDIDLGVITTQSTPITIETDASDFDTELGLFDMDGQLLDFNDDAAGGGLQSEIDLISGLPAGDYIVVLGGFDTLYGNFFQVSPGTTSGNYGLNVAGIPVDGVLPEGGLLNVGFTVGVPEPVGCSLLLSGLLGLAGMIRRRS